jgi:hypothetical protein
MGNSKASSVAQPPAVGIPAFTESGHDQTRDFHFAVTWVTLFAHLDPIESTGPRPRQETSPTLALVPTVASSPLAASHSLAEQHSGQDSNAAWEMVVPKMIRTGQRTFIPAEDERNQRTQELL